MKLLRVKTDFNEVLLRECYDMIENTMYYDVYMLPSTEEETLGNYIGEFMSGYSLEDSNEMFKDELDDWLENNFKY